MSFKQKKILLTGGGTGGSVTPLLAIVEELRAQSERGEYNFKWIGTKNGIEKGMVESIGVNFVAINSGKLRRYFSWKNLTDPIFAFAGFLEAVGIIRAWHPDLIISAGSFVGAPVCLAGWLLRVPILVHQLDARPGLANKLVAPLARKITVTLEKSLDDFSGKAIWTGNPIRASFVRKQSELASAGTRGRTKAGLPTVLILGGGTGAKFLNDLCAGCLGELTQFCRVVHLTGKEKDKRLVVTANYETHDFLDAKAMAEVYGRADLVITRAGMGVLSELAFFGLLALVIPIPGTHQVDNAQVFERAHAAIMLDQNHLSAEFFIELVKKALEDKKLLAELSSNISQIIKKNANRSIINIINYLVV